MVVRALAPLALSVAVAASAACALDAPGDDRADQGGGVTWAYPGVGVLRGEHVCTGSLVRPDRVLTASHCVEDTLAFTVALGEDAVETRRIVDAVRIAGFDPDPARADVDTPANVANMALDLALLELEAPLPAAYPALPIATAPVALDAPATAVGYGRSHPLVADAGTAKRALAVVVNGVDRVEPVFAYYNQADVEVACPGDSGAPLLVPHGEGIAIAGVTSIGSASCRDGFAVDAARRAAWLAAAHAELDR
jgi:trypsin